ncbi:AAA family ATPase [Candidatus Saganbacteria bacterium]|nr:AAA family ATPase [Candidatus Saganbacteria bacterium]
MSRIAAILEGIAESDRVAGAYLFVGPPGVGKVAAAERFADLLGCKKQDRVSLTPNGASLKIEQVRELRQWVAFGPTISRYLTVIIEQADKLTDEAAAAMLKTLEEPAPGVVFLLLSEREDKLPKTILSRCQKLVFCENNIEWRPKAELAPFYELLTTIKYKPAAERLFLSLRLEKEKEQLEPLLYDLASYLRHKLVDAKGAQAVLNTLRFIKRRANPKLALDVMCLRLGVEHGGRTG